MLNLNVWIKDQIRLKGFQGKNVFLRILKGQQVIYYNNHSPAK